MSAEFWPIIGMGITVVGLGITVLVALGAGWRESTRRFDDLSSRMDRRFEELNRRMDSRFEDVNRRFEASIADSTISPSASRAWRAGSRNYRPGLPIS